MINTPSLQIIPRKWQMEAFERWEIHQSGIVKVVTGGGKTVFAFMCMESFLRRNPSGQIVIIVPTLALLDQWYVGLLDELGVTRDIIAIFSGEEKAASLKPINLMVINTARTLTPLSPTTQPRMLIVDECHRAGSEMNSRALAGHYQATLGLSATPEREYDEGFEQFIEPHLGPIVYEYDYVQARADGVISPFKLINISIDLLPDEQDAYDKLSKRVAIESRRVQSGVGDQMKLKRLLQRRASISMTAAWRIPVAAKLVDSTTGERTLIFHERVDAADRLVRILSSRGFRVDAYHTGIGPSLRRDNLRQFRQGMLDVLVTCRALDEGFNVPEASLAVIASATASMRQRIQRLGRVLRPAEGKEYATIITIYATKPEESRLLEEAQDLDGIAEIEWLRGTQA